MSERKITLKNKENIDMELLSLSDLSIELNEGSILNLNVINFESIKNIKISAKIQQNATLNVVFAEFSNDNIDIKSTVNLLGKNATCNWKLATLSNNDSKKKFDISFIHEVGNTNADMNNYGVARDKSNIIFTGINHIKEGAKSSSTRQNAKVIVFDKEASGTASPILKIDENDVVASHGAVVGQLNSDHMFYLMSRGLNKEEARKLITLGYISPICQYFSKETQDKIQKEILEVM